MSKERKGVLSGHLSSANITGPVTTTKGQAGAIWNEAILAGLRHEILGADGQSSGTLAQEKAYSGALQPERKPRSP